MIVIDLEMSGLDPIKNSILSVGAVDFLKPNNQFYMEARLAEDAEVDPEALEVNGFSVKDIKSKKKKELKEVLLEFCKWMDSIDDRTIAGHNVQFDMRFIKHYFYVYNIDYKIGSRCVDTYGLAYVHYLKRNITPPMRDNRADITSDVVFNYCGLPAESHPHIALTAAKMEAESISRLLYGKGLLEEFSTFSIPAYLRQKK